MSNSREPGAWKRQSPSPPFWQNRGLPVHVSGLIQNAIVSSSAQKNNVGSATSTSVREAAVKLADSPKTPSSEKPGGRGLVPSKPLPDESASVPSKR